MLPLALLLLNVRWDVNVLEVPLNARAHLLLEAVRVEAVHVRCLACGAQSFCFLHEYATG